MMIAGGLAGLAGITQYLGVATNMQIGVMPSQGFDGIAVALLGATTPIGSLFAALFFGLLYAGRGFMSVMTDVPPEIADTIIATIIYFAATSILVERVLDKISAKRAQKKEVKTVNDSLIGTDIQNTDNKNESLGFMPPTEEEKKGEE